MQNRLATVTDGSALMVTQPDNHNAVATQLPLLLLLRDGHVLLMAMFFR